MGIIKKIGKIAMEAKEVVEEATGTRIAMPVMTHSKVTSGAYTEQRIHLDDNTGVVYMGDHHIALTGETIESFVCLNRSEEINCHTYTYYRIKFKNGKECEVRLSTNKARAIEDRI